MHRTALIAFATLALLTASCNRDRAEESKPADHSGHPETVTTSTPAVQHFAGHGMPVTFGEASGYLGGPTDPSKKKPGIIVIQEWWGMDDWVKQQTDRFAGQGYVALAVDLYRGKSTKSMDEAHELSRGLPEDRALADLKAGIDFLAARPDVDPNAIGVIGWCMGGGYALKLATQEPRLKATVINYGSLITDHSTIAKIDSRVLGNFGGADRGIPADDVKKFGQTLTAAGKLGDIKVYEGAGHAFMNPNNTQGYDAAAAQDAWKRIDGFFDRTLRANIPSS
ncbi:MAG TPA: dienelactone hydrolase family protein [Thermoanaerobaculia bacterium]|nr:dienelactone hydrolase family protein [Thermoanaerobaculia bacterium]